MNYLKIIKYFAGVIFTIILILLTLQFAVSTKYTFPDPQAFNGKYVNYPYSNIDSTKWRIANFHAHDRKFFGNSKIAVRSAEKLDSLYKYFDYNIISISDYQYLDKYEGKNKFYFPVYEHGFQYHKNHQLVLNPRKVNWLDFPFRQTLSNKQFIIDQLKKDSAAIITIVHPIYRKAYSLNDFKYLRNYDCLEIANHEGQFSAIYDTILSNGHPVYLLADDDAHNLNNIEDVCSSFNLINSDMVKDSILNSLRTGRSIGVKFNAVSFKTISEKRDALLKLPQINSISFKYDTLKIRLNKPVKSIRFIGQKGTERKTQLNCSAGSYYFSPQDTYIRTQIECMDGTIYFLNPLYRFNGGKISENASACNYTVTWTYRSIVTSILLLIFIKKFHKSTDLNATIRK